jgi:uncharacterized protein (TIGR01777 family)
MRIVVAGASGFLGRPLLRQLRGHGHQTIQLVRRQPTSADEVRWDPDSGRLDPAVLDGADAVVNLAGAGVGDKRWTDGYKRVLVESRTGPTGVLARALAGAGEPPGVLLNASAVGYYGDRGEEELTESSPAGTGFFADLVRQWEAATIPAKSAGIRVVHLRSGLVLGPGGGLLGPMLPLFKLGLGGRLASGRQWQPWISLIDELGAIEYLLDSPLAGPVNLTGPAPVRNSEFASTLGRILRRPALFAAPRIGMRVMLGDFAAETLASQRVLPAALTAAGYTYTHADLESALYWAVRRPQPPPR